MGLIDQQRWHKTRHVSSAFVSLARKMANNPACLPALEHFTSNTLHMASLAASSACRLYSCQEYKYRYHN